MIKRDELIEYIHNQVIGKDLLEKAQTIDSYANGVQIIGKEEVNKIAISVSPSMDFFTEAVRSKADYIIMHHGLDLTSKNIINSRLHPGLQKRIAYLLKHDLTVTGYHYSLDTHPKIGNNAVIIDSLGAKRLEETYYDGWGWVAEFDKSQNVEVLAKKCSDLFEHDVFAVYGGPKKIKRIGLLS